MCLQLKHRVQLQFHLLLNHFVHSYVLKTAGKSATQEQPEMHHLVRSQVHLFMHLYTDLEVRL